MEVTLLVTNENANTREVRIGAETFIGRSRECNLRIVSGQVSRKHCVILVRDSRVLVRDLGSANGTEIDGTVIPPEIDVPVAPGSTMVVGPLKLVFEFTPPPPPPPTEEDLQSTTLDIAPVPGPLMQDDTKDYSSTRGRSSQKRPDAASDDDDSGELDFSEDPAAKNNNATTPGQAPSPPDSSLVAGGETVFDSALPEEAREAARRAAAAPPEPGTGRLDDLPPGSETNTVPKNRNRPGWTFRDLLPRSGASKSPPRTAPPGSKEPSPPSSSQAPADSDDDDDSSDDSSLEEFYNRSRP